MTRPASADESAAIELVPESQHLPGQELVERKKYKITFGQIYLSKPMMTESDGDTTTLFPHEARLRNLTCVPLPPAAPRGHVTLRFALSTLSERMRLAARLAWARPFVSIALAGLTARFCSYSAPLYVDMTKTVITTDESGAEEVVSEELPKMFIGKVPIMLRSSYCSLDKHTDAELTRCARLSFLLIACLH